MPGGPPTRTGRVALVVGSAVAAVALLVTGGVVVWNLSGARPYAELPSCRRLLPGELLDAVPGAEGLRAEGEYREADEITDFDPDPALLGYLTCSVFDEDQSASVLWVTVDHYEYDDEGAAAEDLRDDHEDRLADVEDGDWADEWGLEVIDWAPLSTGDGGVAMAVEGGYLDEGGSHGTAYFHAANLGVSLNHSAPRDLEGEEVLAAVDDLAGRIHRQLSREGERA
ncbi:hypothetical protein ACIBFB_15425 [Nocardiopsis sp. NPDC050513]|uniref:hypothetical protein n=1 Tax=Nocardiopsis sp. NPDC050513 TaxID=3364338 RepID=UPI00379D49AC